METAESGRSGQFTNEQGQFLPACSTVLFDRYGVLKIIHHRGQSATIILAKDTQRDRQVVIKALHAHSVWFNIGLQEARILRQLANADPHKFSRTARLLDLFVYDSHVCLVFDALNPKPITQVFKGSSYTHQEKLKNLRKVTLQLLQVAGFLRQNHVIHADLKPENILFKDVTDLNTMKVVDFGNAIRLRSEELALYHEHFEVQSPLYRAPEVFFGLPFYAEIDMWSIGCILGELYLGKPLIRGATRVEMVQSMRDVLGPLPRGVFCEGKFYPLLQEFTQLDVDKGHVAVHLFKAFKKLTSQVDHNFVHLLAGLLEYDPAERLTPHQAALHPFLAPEICLSYLMPQRSEHLKPGQNKGRRQKDVTSSTPPLDLRKLSSQNCQHHTSSEEAVLHTSTALIDLSLSSSPEKSHHDTPSPVKRASTSADNDVGCSFLVANPDETEKRNAASGCTDQRRDSFEGSECLPIADSLCHAARTEGSIRSCFCKVKCRGSEEKRASSSVCSDNVTHSTSCEKRSHSVRSRNCQKAQLDVNHQGYLLCQSTHRNAGPEIPHHDKNVCSDFGVKGDNQRESGELACSCNQKQLVKLKHFLESYSGNLGKESEAVHAKPNLLAVSPAPADINCDDHTKPGSNEVGQFAKLSDCCGASVPKSKGLCHQSVCQDYEKVSTSKRTHSTHHRKSPSHRHHFSESESHDLIQKSRTRCDDTASTQTTSNSSHEPACSNCNTVLGSKPTASRYQTRTPKHSSVSELIKNCLLEKSTIPTCICKSALNDLRQELNMSKYDVGVPNNADKTDKEASIVELTTVAASVGENDTGCGPRIGQSGDPKHCIVSGNKHASENLHDKDKCSNRVFTPENPSGDEALSFQPGLRTSKSAAPARHPSSCPSDRDIIFPSMNSTYSLQDRDPNQSMPVPERRHFLSKQAVAGTCLPSIVQKTSQSQGELNSTFTFVQVSDNIGSFSGMRSPLIKYAVSKTHSPSVTKHGSSGQEGEYLHQSSEAIHQKSRPSDDVEKEKDLHLSISSLSDQEDLHHSSTTLHQQSCLLEQEDDMQQLPAASEEEDFHQSPTAVLQKAYPFEEGDDKHQLSDSSEEEDFHQSPTAVLQKACPFGEGDDKHQLSDSSEEEDFHQSPTAVLQKACPFEEEEGLCQLSEEEGEDIQLPSFLHQEMHPSEEEEDVHQLSASSGEESEDLHQLTGILHQKAMPPEDEICQLSAPSEEEEEDGQLLTNLHQKLRSSEETENLHQQSDSPGEEEEGEDCHGSSTILFSASSGEVEGLHQSSTILHPNPCASEKEDRHRLPEPSGAEEEDLLQSSSFLDKSSYQSEEEDLHQLSASSREDLPRMSIALHHKSCLSKREGLHQALSRKEVGIPLPSADLHKKSVEEGRISVPKADLHKKSGKEGRISVLIADLHKKSTPSEKKERHKPSSLHLHQQPPVSQKATSQLSVSAGCRQKHASEVEIHAENESYSSQSCGFEKRLLSDPTNSLSLSKKEEKCSDAFMQPKQPSSVCFDSDSGSEELNNSVLRNLISKFAQETPTEKRREAAARKKKILIRKKMSPETKRSELDRRLKHSRHDTKSQLLPVVTDEVNCSGFISTDHGAASSNLFEDDSIAVHTQNGALRNCFSASHSPTLPRTPEEQTSPGPRTSFKKTQSSDTSTKQELVHVLPSKDPPQETIKTQRLSKALTEREVSQALTSEGTPQAACTSGLSQTVAKRKRSRSFRDERPRRKMNTREKLLLSFAETNVSPFRTAKKRAREGLVSQGQYAMVQRLQYYPEKNSPSQNFSSSESVPASPAKCAGGQISESKTGCPSSDSESEKKLCRPKNANSVEQTSAEKSIESKTVCSVGKGMFTKIQADGMQKPVGTHRRKSKTARNPKAKSGAGHPCIQNKTDLTQHTQIGELSTTQAAQVSETTTTHISKSSTAQTTQMKRKLGKPKKLQCKEGKIAVVSRPRDTREGEQSADYINGGVESNKKKGGRKLSTLHNARPQKRKKAAASKSQAKRLNDRKTHSKRPIEYSEAVNYPETMNTEDKESVQSKSGRAKVAQLQNERDGSKLKSPQKSVEDCNRNLKRSRASQVKDDDDLQLSQAKKRRSKVVKLKTVTAKSRQVHSEEPIENEIDSHSQDQSKRKATHRIHLNTQSASAEMGEKEETRKACSGQSEFGRTADHSWGNSNKDETSMAYSENSKPETLQSAKRRRARKKLTYPALSKCLAPGQAQNHCTMKSSNQHRTETTMKRKDCAVTSNNWEIEHGNTNMTESVCGKTSESTSTKKHCTREHDNGCVQMKRNTSAVSVTNRHGSASNAKDCLRENVHRREKAAPVDQISVSFDQQVLPPSDTDSFSPTPRKRKKLSTSQQARPATQTMASEKLCPGSRQGFTKISSVQASWGMQKITSMGGEIVKTERDLHYGRSTHQLALDHSPPVSQVVHSEESAPPALLRVNKVTAADEVTEDHCSANMDSQESSDDEIFLIS